MMMLQVVFETPTTYTLLIQLAVCAVVGPFLEAVP